MALWPCYSPAQEKTSDSALIPGSPSPMYQFAIGCCDNYHKLVVIKTTQMYSFCSGGWKFSRVAFPSETVGERIHPLPHPVSSSYQHALIFGPISRTSTSVVSLPPYLSAKSPLASFS